MNKILFFIAFVLLSSSPLITASAITPDDEQSDTLAVTDPFCCTVSNDEEEIIMVLDLHEQSLIIPNQEVFGEMAGYIKAKYDSRYWMITSAEFDKSGNKALLEIINDYGSEDLTATLTYNPKDSTYTLLQHDGATIKFGRNRKWVKISKELKFSPSTQTIPAPLP